FVFKAHEPPAALRVVLSYLGVADHLDEAVDVERVVVRPGPDHGIAVSAVEAAHVQVRDDDTVSGVFLVLRYAEKAADGVLDAIAVDMCIESDAALEAAHDLETRGARWPHCRVVYVAG